MNHICFCNSPTLPQYGTRALVKTCNHDMQCSENIPMVSTTITIDNSPKSKALNNFSNTAQYCDIESDQLS